MSRRLGITWEGHVVQGIVRKGPGRILEIGCGVGRAGQARLGH